jgi:hypothetical protein
LNLFEVLTNNVINGAVFDDHFLMVGVTLHRRTWFNSITHQDINLYALSFLAGKIKESLVSHKEVYVFSVFSLVPIIKNFSFVPSIFSVFLCQTPTLQQVGQCLCLSRLMVIIFLILGARFTIIDDFNPTIHLSFFNYFIIILKPSPK